MFFKKLINLKNDEVKFDNVPKTNKEHISVFYGCIRFIDSSRFSSSSLDSLVKTLVENSNKTLKNLKNEIVDISKIVKGIGEKDRTIEDLEKDYPNKIEKVEEVLLNYIG